MQRYLPIYTGKLYIYMDHASIHLSKYWFSLRSNYIEWMYGNVTMHVTHTNKKGGQKVSAQQKEIFGRMPESRQSRELKMKFFPPI
jgi:hypothetical protein